MSATVLRPQRVLRNWYNCDACDNDWCDIMLVAGRSWCPYCDAAAEPRTSEAFFEMWPLDEMEAA